MPERLEISEVVASVPPADGKLISALVLDLSLLSGRELEPESGTLSVEILYVIDITTFNGDKLTDRPCHKCRSYSNFQY